jgi:microsomal dipeptidase-like Zn-dependent dipeptidase
MLIIDGLQYVNWTRELFEEAKSGGVDAIHVTITYWENTTEALANVEQWEKWFREYSDLIVPVRVAQDITDAKLAGKIGIIFGFQNCSPIEDDLKKVQLMHENGVRIMQLSYNNQSLLATGCYEDDDAGITRFGREVIKEMNRVGMVIDMSHSAEKSTLQAIEFSERPIAITHANPSFFHEALRNKSDAVLTELGASGGMLGVSLYPFHLKDGSDCTLKDFCDMIYQVAGVVGIDQIGIGSDLCQNWGYETLEWMRSGKWASKPDFGEGSAENASWPKQPDWFSSSRDFMNIANALPDAGFNDAEVEKIMGLNWFNFYQHSFVSAVELTEMRSGRTDTVAL